jgi:hypothetical protein
MNCNLHAVWRRAGAESSHQVFHSHWLLLWDTGTITAALSTGSLHSSYYHICTLGISVFGDGNEHAISSLSVLSVILKLVSGAIVNTHRCQPRYWN